MRRFEVGQRYMVTHNARPVGIAQVLDVSRGWVTLELMRADTRKAVRFSGYIRIVHGGVTCECIVPRDYDAIYAGSAVYSRETAHEL